MGYTTILFNNLYEFSTEPPRVVVSVCKCTLNKVQHLSNNVAI